MSKTAATAFAVIVGIVAIATPILVSIQLAKREGLNDAKTQIMALATDVLRRYEESADQLFAAQDRLIRAGAADPCSDANIAIMRELDISSSYLQAVGYVSGTRLICSSLGKYGKGIELGPPDFVSQHGVSIWKAIELPIAPGTKFLIGARGGYAPVIHRDIALDVFTDQRDLSLGLFAYTSGSLLVSRGTFKPAWIKALGSAYETSFFDGEYVVAIRRSQRYDFVAVASVPAADLEKRSQHFGFIMVPLGIAVGIVLTLALIFLTRQQLSLPAVLRVAIKRGEFFLAYQPIVDLQSGQWVGVEALIRWRRSDGSLVRPDLFIPAAEDSGLITRITERVIGLVAKDAPDILRMRPHFHIGINLSAADLQLQRTVDLLRTLAREIGAGPRNILVEATERGLLNADVVRQIVHEIRATGAGMAIDDFGTGYSSLSYLGSFELDYLKIDKSFVDTVGTDAPTSHVVLHIIEMAKSLKLEMIAEGVETEAQAQFLRDRGVQYAQGWLFGKPMPIEEFVRLLAKS